MDQVQEPSEGASEWSFRRIGRSDNRFLEDSLYAYARKGGVRGENPLLGIRHQHWSERPEGYSVRFEHGKARPEGEHEAVAPAPGRHASGLPRVLGRQLVVEGDDDRLFAGEVAI